MGIINQSPIGAIKGAFGNYIGGSWKGRGYVRIRPSSIADTKTPKQQGQSVLLGTITRVIIALLPPIASGWYILQELLLL
jgi:hypothetical protein